MVRDRLVDSGVAVTLGLRRDCADCSSGADDADRQGDGDRAQAAGTHVALPDIG